MDLLGESLPGRTSHEITSLIQNYRKRGKRQISQQESSSNNEKSTSTSTTTASGSSLTRSSKNSPLHQWTHLLGQIIHPRNKRDDLSETLVTVFEGYSNDLTSSTSEDNEKYSSIYQFISDCLQGKCPRELNPQDSLIVLSLLKQAKSFLQYVGCDVEHKFLQSCTQNESQNNSNSNSNNNNNNNNNENNEMQLHEEEEIIREETCSGDGANELHESETVTCTATTTTTTCTVTSSRLPPSTSSSSSSSSAGAAVVDSIECRLSDPVTENSLRWRLSHFVETCMDLPKVKKVKSCLNPLNVPVSMTVEEANCLLEAIEDSS